MSFSPSTAPATDLPVLPPSPPPLINHHTSPPPLTTPLAPPISLPVSPPLPPPPTATSEPPVVTSPPPALPADAPVPPVSIPPPALPADAPVPPVSTPPPPLPVDAPVPPVSTPPPLPIAIPPVPHVTTSPLSTSSPLKPSPPPLTPPQLPLTPSISSTSPSPFHHATSLTPPTVSPLPLKTSPPPLPTISTFSPPPLGPTNSPPIPSSTLVSPSPLPSSLVTVPKSPGFAASPPLSLPLVNQSPPNTQRFHVSIGHIIGCLFGGVVLLIVCGLLCLCYKDRRKKHRPGQDYCKPPICLSPKDKDANFLSKPSQENVPPTRAHVVTVLPKHLGPLRSQAARGSYVSSGSEAVNPNEPQANGSVLSFARGTFTYNELVAATNDFSEDNLLGEGGFGYVHKGVLQSGKEVAVKQLKTGSHQGELEFQAEVETISRIHHKHLVSLVGYCITGSRRLLVYEFVPNNSLEFHLHGKGQPILEWETRLKIAIGSAKGLAYLHEDCSPIIIHRDIKASNILLDSIFEAKVSDFGLAKILPDAHTHISTRVVGTFGYLAPEYASSGKLTDKSDVYSYGIMLLELITGRPPISQINSLMNKSLVDWARPLLNKALKDGNFDALVDPKLDKNYNYNEMEEMIACAAACVRQSAWLRPRMSQIVRALEGDVPLTKLDEAIGHGHSTIYTSSGSSNYDSNQYKDVMKLNMDLAKEYGISGCSESTSEYGLYPSGSSGKQTET